MTAFVLILSGCFLVAIWVLCLGFGLSALTALCVSALTLLFLAGWALWKGLRARRADRQIREALARQSVQLEKRASPDQQAAVRSLAGQFEQALGVLKSSRLGGWRGRALYALPWYVVIGPPGAGKSTAILHSGLKFPLRAAESNVQGTEETRHCDWWLTNEAVLLDTAGRYATEDDDHGEWLAFLDLLRRARPKRPLNGLIVALSMGELSAASEVQLAALAARMRERIDEAVSQLGAVLPVYLTLTKCDLLPGFVETFEELRRAERDQVLGFTFPVKATGDLAQRVEEQWLRLVQVAERRSLLRLADAQGLDARRAVFGFPQQLEALLAKVSVLVSTSFADNVYRDAPILRGVYLTSGAQDGTPVDRLASSLGETLGLGPAPRSAPATRESKSYFLKDLFREVIFPDQDLAFQSTSWDWRLQKTRLGVALALSVAALGLSAIALRAYLLNREIVRCARDELALAVAQVDNTQAESTPLAALEPIRARMATLSEWSGGNRPWAYGVGLYQGDSLLTELESLYASTLRTTLVAPLVRGIEARMAQTLRSRGAARVPPTVQEQAQLYEQLRAYLLLTVPRDGGQPPLSPALQSWLATWLVANSQVAEPRASTLGSRAEPRASTHVAAYLELLAVDPHLALARSSRLVADAREFLARVPAVKLAVDRIVASIEPLDMGLALEAMTGATGLPITARGRIQGAFTRRAWEEQVRPLLQALPTDLLGDVWVLQQEGHDDSTVEARRCAVQSEYFSRYIEEWRSFLGALRVEEPTDHGRALVVLQDLTRGQPPPLERIARAVAYHARLDELKPAPVEIAAQIASTGLLERAKARAQSLPIADVPGGALLGAGLLSERDPCQRADYLTHASVRNALQGFFAFGATFDEPKAGQVPALTGAQVYQEQLAYLRDALQAYVDDPSSSDALLTRLAGARTRVRALIESQEVGWRPRLDTLLWPPVHGASSSSTSALASEKSARWCTSVVHPYARTLRDRYPFSGHGHDAALADLSEFYRPKTGTLWAFYETALLRDVPRRGGGFELRNVRGGPAGYTSELVRFLERSQRLSSALFPPNAERPRVDFEVRVRPSPGIAQVTLNIDGQVADFHNGPDTWVHLTWPGDSDKHGAQLRVRGARVDETLTQEGEWGLFRLLEQGTVDANDGERLVTVRFRLRTQSDVVVDLRPARVENPLVGTKGLLEVFRADHLAAPRAIAVGERGCPE